MKRVKIEPRKNYKEKIESIGFNFHNDYWKEEAYYEFTKEEISTIEKATRECYDTFCEAAQATIDGDLFKSLEIPEEMAEKIKESWNKDDLSLYGRFDFALINGVPKLLEFNADTPTSLLEASVIQWDWKEDLFPDKDQFNSIHEQLVQSWRDIDNEYKSSRYHFACCRENVEDEETVQYLVATAMEAGLSTAEIEMSQLLYDDSSKRFKDPSGEIIETCFKLYPWEWMMEESLDSCKEAEINWIEPIWKSLMSNKGILTFLKKLNPSSPFILDCEKSNSSFNGNYCKKPMYSREGANITLVKNGKLLEESEGDYGYGNFVYQELVEIPEFDGKYPIIGSWIIGGEPAGIGIRETSSRITDNLSEFIPHIIL